MRYKTYVGFFLVVLSHFSLCSLNAQYANDNLYLYDHLRPLEKENIFKTPGFYNWGTSIIKDKDDKYHLFYSRWSKEYKFTGWLTHSEIAHATADSPSGPWEYKKTVLKGRGHGHWDAITAHNPKIKFFEGKYYLYYISSNFGDEELTSEELIETAHTGYSHPNWKPLRTNQRTGVAVSNSIDGPWTRMVKPLIEPSGPITTLTVNPAITQGKDGKYYLIVKGDKPGETRFIRNQAIATSDNPDGPFIIMENPVIDYMDTEDMSLWYDNTRERFYGIFHATHHDAYSPKGFIGLVTSIDGINWKKAMEFVIMPKQLRMSDDSEIPLNRLERPFIYQENGEPTVLSLAVKDGDDSYSIFIPIEYPDRPLPNPRQLAWQEAELGVIFHYDLHVFDNAAYSQGNNRIDPVENHQLFNPKQLDTDQWIRAAKDAGATFALLTATHETGFALYPSDVNPYSVKTLKWKDGKGDIVRDFVNSCRKYGIKPGIYLGIRWNSLLGVHNFKVIGEGAFVENRQKWYNQMVEGMVAEICSNYGELFEIWFDGGADHPNNGAPDVLPIVRELQPNCLFYHNGQLAEARWGGSESGTVGYPNWATFKFRNTGAGESTQREIMKDNYYLLKHGSRSGKYWSPAMSDAPLRGYNGRHEWFWEPGDEDHIFPLNDLMNMYYKSVGRNSTLIIGLTPDPNGLLPEPDVKRLKEWGEEIKKRFSTPIASTNGNGNTLILDLDKPKEINHIIIQENLNFGERVEAYTIQGYNDGNWIELCSGQSIGNKRIERFNTATVEVIRLHIVSYSAIPKIKNLSVFNIEE